MAANSNGLSVVFGALSLVFGLLSFVGWIMPLCGFPAATAAILFGVVSLALQGRDKSGLAVAMSLIGIALGCLSYIPLILGLLYTVVSVVLYIISTIISIIVYALALMFAVLLAILGIISGAIKSHIIFFML